MKIFRLIIMIAALALILYNSTKLNFNHVLEGDSKVALIGIVAAGCAFLLMLILNTAYKIQKKRR